jgi:PadR family transcriptional regulator, regulatory protein PadR
MLEVFVWLERCRLNRDEIPPGTLYLLILKTLARHVELHGYEIANSIQRTSDDVLQVEEGSLYPALQRMLIKGWVTAEWGTTAGNRRARYYKLTAAGRKQLVLEISQFERVMGAIGRVIQTA